MEVVPTEMDEARRTLHDTGRSAASLRSWEIRAKQQLCPTTGRVADAAHKNQGSRHDLPGAEHGTSARVSAGGVDGKTFPPDHASRGFDGKTGRCEGRTFLPDGMILTPDGRTGDRDGKTFHLDGKTFPRDVVITRPSGKTFSRDGRTGRGDDENTTRSGKTLLCGHEITTRDGEISPRDGVMRDTDDGTLSADAGNTRRDDDAP